MATELHRGLLGILVFATLICVPACAQVPSFSHAGATRAPIGRTRVAGEYLVTLSPHANPAVLVNLYSRYAMRRIDKLGTDRFLMVLGKDPGPQKIETLGTREPQIKSVQPNFRYWATPATRPR